MSNIPQQRWACLHDLNNYFKKKDLLGGLSELEKARLRLNIGITDGGSEGNPTAIYELSYKQFNYQLVTKQLVAGARYVILDYQTIYSSNVVNNQGVAVTWGHDNSLHPSPVYKLLVTAVSTESINPNAIIITKENWAIRYDPESKSLPDGYTTKGQITYLRDENDNSAFYDFKNIKFRRNADQLVDSNLHLLANYGDFYTFSNIKAGDIIEDSSSFSNTRHNELRDGCYNNVFIGDTYNNRFEADCFSNSFFNGCHDAIFTWGATNNIFYEQVAYVTGSLSNKKILVGTLIMSLTISKTIHKVNNATIISYLDPITYAYQVEEIV